MVETVLHHFGGIDILADNAGVIDRSDLDIDLKQLNGIAVNLRPVMIANRDVAPAIRSGG